MKPEAELDAKEKAALQRSFLTDKQMVEAHKFAHAFQEIIRFQQPARLKPWLTNVIASGIEALVAFARGILQDLEAVTNAIKLPWSNGQTEGQVNLLKFIKRQMFGRAGFDLLRKRVLGYHLAFGTVHV
jgi:transposase